MTLFENHPAYPFSHGAQCFASGLTIFGNPYACEDWRHDPWVLGWLFAQDAEIGAAICAEWYSSLD